MAAVTLPAAASQQARASRSYSRCAVSYGATPPRLQQRRRRRRAAAVVWAAAELPTVDWTRRSVQQILFVDRYLQLRGFGFNACHMCSTSSAPSAGAAVCLRCCVFTPLLPSQRARPPRVLRHPLPFVTPAPHPPPPCSSPVSSDRTDTVRARFAVGLLERISGWVGCSRVVQSWPCGVDAEAGSSIGWSTQASLFSLAASWQLRPHLFTSPRQRFEEDDIDR